MPLKKSILILFILFFIKMGMGFAQAPVITSFSPQSGAAGSTVTINGSNFTGSNIVYFGAAIAATVSQTGTRIIATVPFGANYQPISVTTNSLSGYSSKPFMQTFTASGSVNSQTFNNKKDFTSGTGVYGVFVKNMDGDGSTDIVVINSDGNSISILKNVSSSGQVYFQPKISIPTKKGPIGIAVDDLNGDGKPDIVATDFGSNQLTIYLNTSTLNAMSFVLAGTLSTGTNPYGVAIADIDGDGRPDIVVTNEYSFPATLTIYHNQSSTKNSVSFDQIITMGVVGGPRGVSVADIDGDGKPDLLVANQGSGFSVLRNTSTTGHISFDVRKDVAIPGSATESVATGDFNADGKLDIAVANNNQPGTVSVFQNTSSPGTVSFSAGQDFSTGNEPFSIAASDLNGDGKPDIVVTNQFDNTVSVLINSGMGNNISFDGHIDYQTGKYPRSVAVADLNGDGAPEIIVGNNEATTVSVLINNLAAKALPPQITSFTPTTAGAGTTITITGTNFTGATIVSFGGIPASSFTVVSDTKITAVLGSGASGDVLVTTPAGTGTASGFVFSTSSTGSSPPNISYQTPQIYTANTAISALSPYNAGGAVPPNIYGQVVTFAGTGVTGTTDGTGTSASFSAPIGMTIDGSGNIFLADYNNNTIRKITPAAVVTTYSGVPGAHGAINGTGANASFAEPNGVAADKSGNIYVADSYNNMVRKITPATTVTTIAGTGGVGALNGPGVNATFSSPSDLAFDNTGNLYITDKNNNMIRKLAPNGDVTTLAGNQTAGSTNGIGTTARFNGPESLAIDASGNIYVADTFNNLIRKITSAGLVTTFAGSGAAGSADGQGTAASFNQPYGITVDVDGSIYVADQKNNKIRKITAGGLVSTLAGSGTGGAHDGIGIGATFGYPGSVVADGIGNIYVGDLTNFLIRKISLTGYTIDKPLPAGLTFDATTGTITGAPTAASPATNYTITAYNLSGNSSAVVNITVKPSTIPVLPPPDISYQTPQTYTVNQQIAPLSLIDKGGAVPPGQYGQVSTIAGSGQLKFANGKGKAASFDGILGLVTDKSGNVYACDVYNDMIRKIAPDGTVTTFAGSGVQGSADGPGTSASFYSPEDIVMDTFGNFFVADAGNALIRKIAPDGTVSAFAGNGTKSFIDGTGTSAGFNQPAALAIDINNNIYVADTQNNAIRKITPSGVVTTIAGSYPAGYIDGPGASAKFNGPTSIAIDNLGNLFVGDYANSCIRKITPANIVSTFAGAGTTGALANVAPGGLTFDQIGNLYITGNSSNIINEITPNGTLRIVAGSGVNSSIDGTASQAGFHSPQEITADNMGNLYVAEGDVLLRKINVTGFTIDKPLPAGLSFDFSTGNITGTPTSISPATNYTVTAYNPGGSSTTVVNIAVIKNTVALPLPPNISYQTPQTYTVSTAISPLKPLNTGGAVPAATYGQVSLFAGTGSTGAANGTGNGASFNFPKGMVTDAAGNIYVADQNNFLIREITPGGVVTTFAGNGQQGNTNGARLSASFNGSSGIAIDADGNLYITDTFTNSIRKITAGGLVSTFAGAGTSGNKDGPGATATFNDPQGIAIDAGGNLYVADFANSSIRKIAPDGTVSTLAGNGTSGSKDGIGTLATFNGPSGVAVDATGNIYVVDSGDGLVRKITPGGVVTTFAGNGLLGTFSAPNGITIDAAGNIYVIDPGSKSVYKIDTGGKFSTVATGIGTYPGYIVIDTSGNLYVSDTITDDIYKIQTTGYTIDNPLPAGLLFDPTTGIITGTPTVASPPTNYTVTAYNTGGSSSTVVNITVKAGTVPLPLPPNISYQTPQTYATKTAITPLSPTNVGGAVPANPYGEVTTIAGTGTQGNTNGPAKTASFGLPVGITVGPLGDLYVTEFANNDVRKITPGGLVSTLAGSGAIGSTNGTGTAASFSGPYSLTTDASGNLFVADKTSQMIRQITPAGVVTTYAGSGTQASVDGLAASAEFTNPIAAVFDAAGNLYVADSGNSRIRKIDQAGNVTTFAVLDPSADPDNNFDTAFGYLAIDASGNLYLPYDNTVKKISPAGVINNLAGSGYPGFANGAGTAASFDNLVGIAVDALGNVYVADNGNNAIRKITPAGVVTTVAGGTSGARDGIGPASSFNGPYGISLDNTGSYLFVTDTHNNTIRQVMLTGYTIDKPLPAGLAFDPSTGIISGTPTVASPATNYTVTAYNIGGSSTTIVNITVSNEQTISFSPLADRTVCDADFDPQATGSGPVTYTSSDITVASIVSGKIHIVGPGQTTITADDGTSQATQVLTVVAAVQPTITISPVAADDCQGSSVTFTAVATNGGTSPVYQWQVNGVNSGDNSATFTSTSLNNNDQITCILTSNAVCTISTQATSNTATFTIDAPVTASIAIISSATGPICPGTTVTFTANANTSDPNPTYQWQVNGNNAGTNSPIFTINTLSNGDVVTCVLTSAAKCQVNPSALSNAITTAINSVSLCTVVVPNTITPNGDGINDVWNISSLQGYPGCSVSIYSRYGALLFNSIGYPKAWDGTYKNSALPVGTYYYVIDLKNGGKPLSGFIAIIK